MKETKVSVNIQELLGEEASDLLEHVSETIRKRS